MLKKVRYSVIIIVSLSFFFVSFPVYAETINVKDCLENDGDCPELNGTVDQELDDRVESTQEFKANQSTGSLLINILKTVLALFLVLALIYIFIKIMNKRHKLFHQIHALENLGGISVGQNKSIQVIRIGNKLYLIGVGDNVEMLQEIKDEDVKAALLQDEQNAYQEQSLFTNLIQTITKRKTPEQNHSSATYQALFKDELKKLKEKRETIVENFNTKDDAHG